MSRFSSASCLVLIRAFASAEMFGCSYFVSLLALHWWYSFLRVYIWLYVGTAVVFGWLTIFLSSRAPSSVGTGKCRFFYWWHFLEGGIGISPDFWDSLLFGKIFSLLYFPSLTSFQKHPCPVASSPSEVTPYPHCQPLSHEKPRSSIQFPSWPQSCSH